ncbi:unnamed protein product [Closterium sp. NIES-54]
MLLAHEGDPDAPDLPTPRSYAEAITGPYSSQWQTAMDIEMASWKTTSTYVDTVSPSEANIVDGMWIFRVKRPPGSPPAFKARYVARGFKEIWLRRPPGFTGSFPAGTQWSLQWPVYGLRHAPREWQDTLRTTLANLGFSPSTADPSLFLHTDTSLPPFYVLVYVDDLVFATPNTEALALVKSVLQKRHTCTDSTPLPTGHSLSAPPSDESVEPSGLYPELVGCLIRSSPPSRAAPLSRAAPPPPNRTALLSSTALHCPAAITSTSATAPTAAMASPTVLTFDAEGRAVHFDMWVDDLQLFLQCDSRDGVSLFDHKSGVSTAPAATADSNVRSQWTTRDAVARLAVRSHLPPAERAHFGQYKTAQSLYDNVVARYSSPATAESGGAESGRAEPGGAEPGRVEPEGAVSGGAEPARAAFGGALGVPPRREPLSPQQLREWYSRRCWGAAGATGSPARDYGGAAGTGGAVGTSGGAAGAGAAGGGTGAGGTAGASGGAARAGGTTGVSGGAAGAGAARGAAGPGGAAGAGAAGGGAGAGAAGGAAGAGAARGAKGTGDPGAEGTGYVSAVSGGVVQPRPYYVSLLQQVLGSPPSPGPPPPPLLSPPPVQSQSQLQPASPLPGPSPYSRPTRGLTERREPESRPMSPKSRSASPVRTVRAGRVSRPRPPPVPGTHSMTLRPSTAPQRVPLPSPTASSPLADPDPAFDSLRAASPAVTRFLATAVTDPLFESTAVSALVAELVDFAAACRLDYAARLVTGSASVSICPPSVGGECALGTDVLEDRQEEFECFADSVPHLVSMLLAPEGDPDAPDIPTPRSYAEAIEGPYSSQWQAAMDAEMASWKSTGTYVDEVPPPGANIGVEFFQTFSPTLKMTTLWVLLHVAAQHDYELHSLDFSTAFLQGSVHEEIWLCRPPGFTGSFPAGTQWSLQRPVYGLRQAPREWHDTLRTTLASLGFAPSTADPSLFLRTDTTLPPFYVLVYVDDLVFATADTQALAHVKSEL